MDDALTADRHKVCKAILPPCRGVVSVSSSSCGASTCACVGAGLVLSGQWLWLIAVFPTQQQNETAWGGGAVKRALLQGVNAGSR